MKYILVTGGVFNGVGKTVVSSSIGKMLKSHGLEVTFVKVDSCLNLDAGSCACNGEIYVLEDGGEVDVDLGNYERSLDILLHADNHITAGKIYREVIGKERRGDYLGCNVQVKPHLTNAFRIYLERVSQIPVCKTGRTPEVCIIELNGAIDDTENQLFVECFKQFKFAEEYNDLCSVHVTYIPKLVATDEFKIEPAQTSISKLRALGLEPDFVICRSASWVTNGDIEEISRTCHVPLEQIMNLLDLDKLYQIPHLFKRRGMAEFLAGRLKLKLHQELDELLEEQWLGLEQTVNSLTQTVNVAVVGEYTKHKTRYPSVVEALYHAGIKAGCKVSIEFIQPKSLLTYDNSVLEEFECVVVSGTFGIHDTKGQIEASKVCREKKIPFLGIGLGFHTAVIEMAQAFDPKLTETDVVMDAPEDTVGNDGTLRCGRKTSIFKDTCTSNLRLLYGNRSFFCKIQKRHSSKHLINPELLGILERNGTRFVATDCKNASVVDIMELPDDVHPYYVACRYHPEYSSRLGAPSPAFLGLLLAAKNQLKAYLIDAGPKSITHTIFQNYKKTAEEERELDAFNNVEMSYEHMELLEKMYHLGHDGIPSEMQDAESEQMMTEEFLELTRSAADEKES